EGKEGFDGVVHHENDSGGGIDTLRGLELFQQGNLAIGRLKPAHHAYCCVLDDWIRRVESFKDDLLHLVILLRPQGGCAEGHCQKRRKREGESSHHHPPCTQSGSRGDWKV